MKYIIGDVHGCYDTLMALIAKLPKDAEIVFVGDLVDRGPKNRDVINFVRKSGHACTMGNHEELMFKAVHDILNRDIAVWMTDWEPNGGRITYAEYEGDKNSLISDTEWMKTLPRYLHFPNEKDALGRELVVSHAPCLDFFEDLLEKRQDKELVRLSKEKRNPNLPIHKRQMEIIGLRRLEEAIIWNRRIPRYEDTKYFNVCGHNIISNFIFNPSGGLKVPIESITPENIVNDRAKSYAAIDSGCYVKKPGKYHGRLTCIEFPTMRVIQQENIEKEV